MPATKTNLKVSTVPYVIVYVKDMAKAIEFYEGVLGIKVKTNAGDEWVELATENTTIALHKDDGTHKSIGNSTTIVFGVENAEKAYDQLKAAGAKNLKAPQTVCETPSELGRSIELQDPDGHVVSLFAMEPRK